MDGTTDALLGGNTVERALHADPHDFAGLYIRHRSSLVLHARRYLSNTQDADEVVQEAFLRLFLALPELETELQALAYSRRTITNLCIDRFRAQARRPRLVALDTVPVNELADDDPGDPVVRAEDAAMVREALSLLSPLHRAALVKREIEEKSLPVIAAELEIPEDTVKHVLFRARRALRRLLEGTSLVPGGDVEFGKALGKIAAVGPGGMAVMFVALVVGLGSGPNLKAIPVVGVDLPNLIHVTEIARAVGGAVNDVASSVASVAGRTVAPADPTPAEPAVLPNDTDVQGGAPVSAPDPSPSPTSTVLPSPAASPSVVPTPALTVAPSPSPSMLPTVAPSPSGSASPSGPPSPSPSTEPDPSASPSTGPSEESAPRTVEPVPSPTSSPVPADPKASTKPEPSPTFDGPGRGEVPVVSWTS